METLYGVVGFFQSGGPFMFPILIVLAFGTAIAIERYIYLALVRARNRGIRAAGGAGCSDHHGGHGRPGGSGA